MGVFLDSVRTDKITALRCYISSVKKKNSVSHVRLAQFKL